MDWIGAAIAALFGLSLGGLAYGVVSAAREGADAYAEAYASTTAQGFEDIFLFIPPRRIVDIGWGIAVALFLIVFLAIGSVGTPAAAMAGLVLGLALGAGGFHLPRIYLEHLRRRRRLKFNTQLVDALVNISNALRAGFSLMQAFEAIVKEGENPIAQEFDVFLHQTRVGVSFTDALDNLEQRVGSEDMLLVARAVDVARRTGGNLAETLEKISHTIRERFRVENRIRTLTSMGRLQGTIVGLMPLAIGVILAVMDPQLMLPFLVSPFGLGIIVAVIGMIAAGAVMIRKIVNIDV